MTQAAVALRISIEELRAKPGHPPAESEAHEVKISLLKRGASTCSDDQDGLEPHGLRAVAVLARGQSRAGRQFRQAIDQAAAGGRRPGRFALARFVMVVAGCAADILDLIGGARPSIADPFLPNKIDEGREDQIRECIGCNICISSWHDGVPVRCTQNPTAGEEWRRDFNTPSASRRPRATLAVLVVGGDPAGLECATTLARRGYPVTLADAAPEFGGRLRFETALPGLNTWNRVATWRLGQLRERPNVNLYPGSALTADDVLGLEHRHVVIATGARWTKMLFSTLEFPVGELDVPGVYTPDDLAAGVVPQGPVVVFDFDNYYLAGAGRPAARPERAARCPT